MHKRMLLGAIAGVLMAMSMTLGLAGSASADQTSPADLKAAKIAASDGSRADWTCSDTHPDKDHSTYPKPFDGATNVRSGPSTDCAIVGVVSSANKADYHCWVPGDEDNENTWTYLRFKDNHYGFVRDDLLDGYGSGVEC
jgi:hypothetical protein